MTFIRPDALAALRRWRETILSLVCAGLAAWLMTRGGWFYGILGGAALAFALGLALTAWRRLRFSQPAEAPGIVEIDEGAIGYFGPESGGAVALSELARVEALTVRGALHWRLTQEDGRSVTIPAAALGADKLFDTFAALPGASPRAFLAALDTPPRGTQRLWQRGNGAAEPRLPRPGPR